MLLRGSHLAARSPSSVCVGGIRMSTTATSGLCMRDVAQQILGVAGLRDGDPPSGSNRAIPSRRSTESSASEHDRRKRRDGARKGGKSERGRSPRAEDPLEAPACRAVPRGRDRAGRVPASGRCGRLGGDDLSSVARGRDPRRDGRPTADVAVLGEASPCRCDAVILTRTGAGRLMSTEPVRCASTSRCWPH